MDHRDRQAIEELFGKLAEVERRTGPRDAEAERFIAERIADQRGAPYYMAQTIIVQEQALVAAQQRIEELEQSRSGGFLGGLFGSRPPAGRMPARQGYRSVPNYGAPAGGGFLAGAAQTAVGVAGGVLLANMITGAFAGEPSADAGDGGSDYDSGGDFDTGGDFDVGGFGE